MGLRTPIRVLLTVLLFGVPDVFSQSTLVFPQLVEGEGSSSNLVVMNAGLVQETTQIEFFDSAGQPLELTVEGTQQSSISNTIAAGGFTVVETSGSESLRSGYALVRSAGSRLAGTLGVLLGEDEIVFLDAPPGNEHLVLIEQSATVRTGLAIVNLASQESTVRLEALNEQGEVLAEQTLLIEAGHRLARFADQLFADLPLSFQGILRAGSEQPFSLMGVLQDSAGGLRSLPASRLEDPELPMPGPELFSGSLALEHVADQMAHGPRPTGSSELEKSGDEIRDKLLARGWNVEQDLHTLDLGSTQIPVRNLVARTGEGSTVILGAHYDTRIWADQDQDPALREENVPGANDGGSGTAVLLELARVISEHYVVNGEIRLGFFDAEDIQFMILVDLVGDMNQRFLQEAFSRTSAPDLVEEIWSSAASLGFEDIFLPQSGVAPWMITGRSSIWGFQPSISSIWIIRSGTPPRTHWTR